MVDARCGEFCGVLCFPIFFWFGFGGLGMVGNIFEEPTTGGVTGVATLTTSQQPKGMDP